MSCENNDILCESNVTTIKVLVVVDQGKETTKKTSTMFEVAIFESGTIGERILNAQDGSFEFVTDHDGVAHIGALPPGSYIITEKHAPRHAEYEVIDPVVINITGEEVETKILILRRMKETK